MTKKPIFEVLILIGRPAAGKSEILDHLANTEKGKRIEKYHIGQMDVIDDFPMLWTWFEEDDILSGKLGKSRLHSDEAGYFKFPYLWDLLIERISLEYGKRTRDDENYHTQTTSIIEFSRGAEHGGYSQAFQHLSPEILERAGVVYVRVSFAESLRKNQLRFNPDKPDSILEHGLEDEKMKRLYADDDWEELSSGDPSYLTVRGVQVPYVVFENEDDISTRGGSALGIRLEEILGKLWGLVVD
jgi:hypothetical protein